MTQAELLARVRAKLRDAVGDSSEQLWTDAELIDEYGNYVRDRLFLKARFMVVDSTTASDSETVPNPLCQLSLVADTGSYAMSPKIIKTMDVQLESMSTPLPRVLAEHLSIKLGRTNWRTLDPGTPKCWCPNLETDKIVFLPAPDTDDTAYLTVSRFPLTRLDNDASPAPTLGFREEYHEALIPGIMAMAYEKRDTQTFRPDDAAVLWKQFYLRCEEIRLEIHRRSI